MGQGSIFITKSHGGSFPTTSDPRWTSELLKFHWRTPRQARQIGYRNLKERTVGHLSGLRRNSICLMALLPALSPLVKWIRKSHQNHAQRRPSQPSVSNLS